MGEYEYMWLLLRIYPQYFIAENQIEHLFINNRILVKIRKCMYGLPQAGRLAYIVLIKTYNYMATPVQFAHKAP